MNNSGPDKKNYRIMNIKNDSNDDYLAIRGYTKKVNNFNKKFKSPRSSSY